MGEVFGQFMPKDAELPGKNKEDDKKSKKDDKKDKKGDKDDDKKDKKGDKDKGKDEKKGKDSKAKKGKDAVKLNKAEELQVNNFIRNMVFGESGKNKSIVSGWVNMIDEKDIAVGVPWEFQIAHCLRHA